MSSARMVLPAKTWMSSISCCGRCTGGGDEDHHISYRLDGPELLCRAADDQGHRFEGIGPVPLHKRLAGMNDTTPQVKELHRDLPMARSNEERFKRGISMCQTARPDSRRGRWRRSPISDRSFHEYTP